MAGQPIMPRQHPFVKAVADALRQRCGVPAGGARLVVATSGGADSVALLRALAMLADRRTWKLELAVGHVQHHLRPAEEAEGDAAFVAALARKLDLPFVRADLSQPAGAGNMEAWARAARYEALVEMARAFDAAFIATAHQADDQLETLLMRLLRGTSVKGLAGIAWRRSVAGFKWRKAGGEGETPGAAEPAPTAGGLHLIRPMLAVDRTDAQSFLRHLEQPWREDHTNADLSRLRARLRREVTPALAAISAEAPRRAVTLADHLRQVARLLEQAVAAAADRVLLAEGSATFERVDARLLPPVVLAGLLRRLLAQAGVPRDRLGGRTLGPIVRAVRDTQGGERSFRLSGGAEVVVLRDMVKVSRK